MKQLMSQLRAVGTPTLYRRNASLYFQGEVPRYATVVVDGVVKAYTISPEGEETIVSLFTKGAVLPSAWVSDNSPTALFNYDAVNDVRAIRIKKDEFQHVINQNPALQQEFLRYLSETMTSMMLRVTGLCQSRATEKICYTLYYLLFRHGIERENGNYEIDLKITQGMLASLIGQTRESTAKNLKLLKDAGIVEYTSSVYIVNKPKLESYMGEDAFRNLTI